MTAKSGPSAMKRSCREGDCFLHHRLHKASDAGLGAASAVEEGGNWDIVEKGIDFKCMPVIAALWMVF
jgi:hypothetical protein